MMRMNKECSCGSSTAANLSANFDTQVGQQEYDGKIIKREMQGRKSERDCLLFSRMSRMNMNAFSRFFSHKLMNKHIYTHHSLFKLDLEMTFDFDSKKKKKKHLQEICLIMILNDDDSCIGGMFHDIFGSRQWNGKEKS